MNGDLGERSRYHLEALWSEASTPNWVTTPSYPPISPYNGTQLIEPGHPGRQAYCGSYAQNAGFNTREACLENDWYFFGRVVGNSGPHRTLRRDSRTQRLAASLERDLEVGGREAAFEVAGSFSRSTGNANLPGEYLYRKFLAFRGFGAELRVGVVVDPTSPSGMALGPLGGAVAGQGGCLYYNPFSNAHPESAQPGSPYFGQGNPDYVAGLDNTPELNDWMNDEVNLDNVANLITLDAMFKGTLTEEAAYALGSSSLSVRRTQPRNLADHSLPRSGDRSCSPRLSFHSPPASSTTTRPIVHRLFAESHSRDRGGSRQVAANYSSTALRQFDRRCGARQAGGAAALRSSQDHLSAPLGRRPERGRQYRAGDVSERHSTRRSIYVTVADPERAFTSQRGDQIELTRLRTSLDTGTTTSAT